MIVNLRFKNVIKNKNLLEVDYELFKKYFDRSKN